MNPVLKEIFSSKEKLQLISDSVTKTVSDYTRLPVEASAPRVCTVVPDFSNFAIGSCIRFDGPQLSFELFLGFSLDLFSVMYQNIFQNSIQSVSLETQDLAGEILNIAFGYLDPRLKTMGVHCRSSFPKIYSGDALKKWVKQLPSQDIRHSIEIPCSVNGKSFGVFIHAPDSLAKDWKYTPKKAA